MQDVCVKDITDKVNEYNTQLIANVEITQEDDLFYSIGPIETGPFVGKYAVKVPDNWNDMDTINYITCVIHYKDKEYDITDIVHSDENENYTFEDLQISVVTHSWCVVLPLNFTEELNISFTNISYNGEPRSYVSVKAIPVKPITDLTSESVPSVNFVNEHIS